MNAEDFQKSGRSIHSMGMAADVAAASFSQLNAALANLFQDQLAKQINRATVLTQLMGGGKWKEHGETIMDMNAPVKFWNKAATNVTWNGVVVEPGGTVLIEIGYAVPAPGHRKSTVEEMAPQLVPDPEDRARLCVKVKNPQHGDGRWKIWFDDPEVGQLDLHEGTLKGAATMARDSAVLLLTDLYKMAAQDGRKPTLNEIRGAITPMSK